jgi:hypothetical protein
MIKQKTDDSMPRFWIKLILIWAIGYLVFSSLAACQSQKGQSDSSSPRRVLLIGDSYTSFNEGLDKHLTGLAPQIVAGRVASAGATLETHGKNTDTLHTIRTGHWNVVVLQERSQTPILEPEIFTQSAGKLTEEIKKAGAKAILLMTWERPDSVQWGVTTANLSAVFTETAQRLDLKVAPVAMAFFKALEQRPDLRLYALDGRPTLPGTYLAACVCYGVIFEKSPVGNPYSAGLPETDKIFLQKTAAQVLGY